MSSIAEQVKEHNAREALKVGDKVYIKHFGSFAGDYLERAIVTKRTSARITVGSNNRTFTLDGNQYPRSRGNYYKGSKLFVPTPELDMQHEAERIDMKFSNLVSFLYDNRRKSLNVLTLHDKQIIIKELQAVMDKVLASEENMNRERTETGDNHD